MKKQILILVATLGFTFGLAGISVNAQTHGKLAANIPFDFYAGNQKFTAGEYTIESANPQSDGATLIIRHKDGKSSKVLIMTPKVVNGERKNAEPSLVFNQYDSEYFLSEVLDPAQNYGAAMSKSKVEMNLARRYSTTTPKIVAMMPAKR